MLAILHDAIVNALDAAKKNELEAALACLDNNSRKNYRRLRRAKQERERAAAVQYLFNVRSHR